MVHISKSNLYSTLVFFSVIFSIMLFNSYGNVLSFNLHTYKPFGFMQNFWEMWKPSFGVSAEYSSLFNMIQMPFYIFILIFFVRKVRLISMESFLFLFMSLVYAYIHGNARYREPFIMILVLWFCNYIKQQKI